MTTIHIIDLLTEADITPDIDLKVGADGTIRVLNGSGEDITSNIIFGVEDED